MRLLRKLQWYYFTRVAGVGTAMFVALLGSGTERGVIVMAFLGLAGVDWVARREPPTKGEKEHDQK